MLHHLPRPVPFPARLVPHQPPPRLLPRRAASPTVDSRPPPFPFARDHSPPSPHRADAPPSSDDDSPSPPAFQYDSSGLSDPATAAAAMYPSDSIYAAPPTASSSSGASNPGADMDNDPSYASARRPPPVFTHDLLPQSEHDLAAYSASPHSESPSMGARAGSGAFSLPTQPMSGQYASFGAQPQSLPTTRYPHAQNSNPLLDRRMSEPVLSQRYAQSQLPNPQSQSHAPSQSSQQPQYAYPPAQSPRTVSVAYAYPPYPQSAHGHARIGSGSSGSLTDTYGATASNWPGPLKHDLTEGAAPVSPVYAGSVSGSEGVGSSPPLSGSRLGPGQARPGAPQGQVSQGQAELGPGPLPPPGTQTHQRSANGKTYSFVSLPGNAVKKRPRRRYDEIERLYQCRCVFLSCRCAGLDSVADDVRPPHLLFLPAGRTARRRMER